MCMLKFACVVDVFVAVSQNAAPVAGISGCSWKVKFKELEKRHPEGCFPTGLFVVL